MTKILAFIYGILAYFLFFGTFLYMVGFVGNFVVPKSIDSGVERPLLMALGNNLELLLLFAIQHSLMARQGFKKKWIKLIPKPIERSTFVGISSLLLLFIFYHWKPVLYVIWDIKNPFCYWSLWVLSGIGWATVFFSTLMISHTDLFGLRQVYFYFKEKEYTFLDFKIRSFYKWIRHPLYLGFMMAFWSTPRMTLGHLLFAGFTTIYMLLAVQLEERDLIKQFGETYTKYQKEVSMILPIPKRKS